MFSKNLTSWAEKYVVHTSVITRRLTLIDNLWSIKGNCIVTLFWRRASKLVNVPLTPLDGWARLLECTQFLSDTYVQQVKLQNRAEDEPRELYRSKILWNWFLERGGQQLPKKKARWTECAGATGAGVDAPSVWRWPVDYYRTKTHTMSNLKQPIFLLSTERLS